MTEEEHRCGGIVSILFGIGVAILGLALIDPNVDWFAVFLFYLGAKAVGATVFIIYTLF